MTDVVQADVRTRSITSYKRTAILFGVLTGIIHLYVGVVRGRPALVLAGIGFFGGIGLFLAGYRRKLLAVLGCVYVLVQIVIWAVVNAGEYRMIGFVDKSIQVVLVLLLGYLYLWTRRTGSSL